MGFCRTTRPRRVSPLLAAPLLAFSLPRAALAEAGIPATPEWGTAATSYVQVPPASFRPRRDTIEYNTNSLGQSLFVTGGAALGEFHAGVSLPSGAQIVSVELQFNDVSATGAAIAFLVACDSLGASCNQHPGPPYLDSGAAFAGGQGTAGADISGDNLFVDNRLKHYSLVVVLSPAVDVELRGMTVGYRLRVSPPPGAATFADVPVTHPFFQFVEALSASGITVGCGGVLYCPDQPLTRGQMAVFLAKALGLQFP